MKLSTRERILIIVGSLLIAVTAYIFYFVMPLNDRATKSNADLNEAHQQIQILKSKAIGVKKLEENVNTLSGDLKKTTATLMSSMDDAQILLYLQKLTDSRVTNLNVVFDPNIDSTSLLLHQTVTLEFNATYRNMTDIIDALNKAEVYNRVQVVNATYRTQSGSTGPAAATPPADAAAAVPRDPNVLNVHIETYFYARKPDAGITPKPALTPTKEPRDGSIFPDE